jgi:enoyl-CoA hydratase/carnithine racemase
MTKLNAPMATPQIRVTRLTPAFWRITFDNPPLNLMGPQLVGECREILSQWEVGTGLVAGGGPMARLPRLMGRGRALEVLPSSARTSTETWQKPMAM